MDHIVPRAVMVTAYRHFRNGVIASLPHQDSIYPLVPKEEGRESKFAIGRGRITAFREHVVCQLKEKLRADISEEGHMRRAIGIPYDIPLTLSRPRSIANFFQQALVRDSFNYRYVSRMLRRIRTFQGRKYVFSEVFKTNHHDLYDYDESADFALRRLSGVNDREVFKHISRIPLRSLRAVYRLGIRSVDQTLQHINPNRSPLVDAVIGPLIDERIISEPEDLQHLVQYVRRDYCDYYHYRDLDIEDFRSTCRLLLQAGIPPVHVLKVLKSPYSYDPNRLCQVLTLVELYEVNNFCAIFEHAGPLLWNADVANWKFIFEELGIRDGEDVRAFKRILHSSTVPSSALVRQLRSLGACVEDLSYCEALIAGVKEKTESLTARIDLLSHAPFSLSVRQIGVCDRYVASGNVETLKNYLEVLKFYDFITPDEILAFQPLYTSISPKTLHALLNVLRERDLLKPINKVVKWLSEFNQRKAAYRETGEGIVYLATAITLKDFEDLTHILPIAELHPRLLRYLIERKRLTWLNDLKSWYKRFGQDAKKYWAYSISEPLEEILFDDAINRADFSLVVRNSSSLREVISDVTRASMTVSRNIDDKDSIQAYNEEYARILSELEKRLKSELCTILHENDGILLRSTIRAVLTNDDEARRTSATKLGPIIETLLNGEGPTEKELSPLELDAISLIYGVEPNEIRHIWPLITEVKAKWDHLRSPGRYTMTWRKTEWVSSEPIDKKLSQAVLNAVEIADRFSRSKFVSIFEACKHMRSRRLDPSAEVSTLEHHLGVLLAAAGDFVQVKDWLQDHFSKTALLDGDSSVRYRWITALDTLLDSGIREGLQNCGGDFVNRFSDEDAAFLAARLQKVPTDHLSLLPSTGGRELLLRVLDEVRNIVSKIYRKAISKELKKFKGSLVENDQSSPLVAVVSKSPVAFLARKAAKLCTADNVTMWREDRHAHLLVFDQRRKRLVAMAMLYAESFKRFTNGEKTLVVRAINPTEDAADEYDASSIVDAFIDVCIRIAESNGFASVALPANGYGGLLSNRTQIEKNILARYRTLSKARRASNWEVVSIGGNRNLGFGYYGSCQDDEAFYAYEHGREEVKELCRVWQRNSAPTVAGIHNNILENVQ